MNNTSPETEKQVIALKLQGFSNREINKETGASIGTVSNIFTKFTETYGQEPESIMEFYRQLKKSGITASDVIKASITHAKLKRLKINEEELDFLSKVYSKCKDEGIQPEDLAKHAKSLLDVQTSSDISLKELPSYYEKMHNQYLDLAKTVEDLEEKELVLQKKLSSILQDKDKIANEVQEYHLVKKKLDNHNITISNAENLATMLNQAKENKFNIGEIKNYLLEERGLLGSMKQLTSNLARLEREIQDKSKQLAEVSNKLDLITKEYKHLSSVIDIIENLSSKGINSTAILQWNEILISSGSTPKSLIKDLGDYTSLEEVIKSNEKTLDTIQEEMAKLMPQVKALKLEKSSLEASIDKITLYITNTIGKVSEKAENVLNKLHTRSQQELISCSQTARENMTRVLDETTKETVQCSKNIQAESKEILSTTKSEIMDLVYNLQNISEEFGRMDALTPLFKIISKRPVSREEGLVAFESLIQHIQNWTEMPDSLGLKNSLKNLQSQVKLHLATIPA